MGVSSKIIPSVVTSMIFKFGLSMFIETKAGALSGGNKRKLCLAMAMMGRPKIVFIDEASAGVDPASRRVMWNAIKDEGQDSAVVITTHAMEEAEALSSKLGIMVAGKFKCFGTIEHIKQEYGLGYEIEVNFDSQFFENLIQDVLPETRYESEQENIRKAIRALEGLFHQ